MGSKRIDYTGQTIAGATIQRRIAGTRHTRWICVCECGEEFLVYAYSIRVAQRNESKLTCLECAKQGEKRCNKCQIVKPLPEFHTHPTSRDGRQPTCRECRAKRSRRLEGGSPVDPNREPGFRCRDCLDLYHRIPLGSRCRSCGRGYAPIVTPSAVHFLGRREMAHGVRRQSGMRGNGVA